MSRDRAIGDLRRALRDIDHLGNPAAILRAATNATLGLTVRSCAVNCPASTAANNRGHPDSFGGSGRASARYARRCAASAQMLDV